MDKAEYRVMLDQITALVDAGDYTGALPIVEQIDWRRVKSIRTLCMVSEIYEANKRLEDSLRVLKIAYKRGTISKTVLYRLSEVCAKLGDYKGAIDYYKEFEEISPMDNSKYILKYEIYRAKGESLDEQIRILEDYKDREYTEKWAYELAMLYSEAGMINECVETCDDLILWFNEGSYVVKSMELKKKYVPLTPSQSKKYEEQTANRVASVPKWEMQKEDLKAAPVVQMDPSQIQNQLADSIRSVFSGMNRDGDVVAPETEDSTSFQAAEQDMTDYEIKELEPESTDAKKNEPKTEPSPEEPEEPEFDLEALLAETTSSLAQEVASGGFDMTDEVIEVAEEDTARREIEEVARQAEEESQIHEKETDETLGLTREFNFNEELKKTASDETLSQDTEDPSQNEINLEDLEQLIQAPVEDDHRLPYVPVEPRDMTTVERDIFSYFTRIPGMSQQITETISDVHNNAGDKTSKSGNFLIIGRQGSGKTKLYENMVLAICNDLGIKTAKMAKIIGRDLNKKDVPSIVAKMSGGFLVIEGAGELSDESVAKLSQAMEFRTDGLVVVLEDEKADLFEMLDRHPELSEKFTSSIKIPVFTNDELVTFAKTYASENGYKMDEMGVLALYTKIGNNQKNSEPVTVGKVKDIMDDAIVHANKGTRKFGRKFSKNAVDEDNRVLLLEKDFE